ncbi:hypothetical protein [Ruegeria sp. HKCCE4150]|uniref:hypothetical protein n=1 Tax=Ruegeria sp. HKCCE4150 TaxID=2794828 RepID=UPI001AE91F88|nr:hypothetical protein [Ruegeria sp. HKCCE4150]
MEILQNTLNGVLAGSEVTDCYERLITEDFVKPYGELGYHITDTERYFFLNFAFAQVPELGELALRNLIEYFDSQRDTLSDGYQHLAASGYYDAIGVFEIESFHVRLYDSTIDTTQVLRQAFARFTQWRSDPVFNHGLNRRLVKALRDHIRTGLISSDIDTGIVNLMEFSTPPWSHRTAEKQEFLGGYNEVLQPLKDVYPFYCLELAKVNASADAAMDDKHIHELFYVARRDFEVLDLPYYQAEALRHEANYLTSTDQFPAADDCLRAALELLKNAQKGSENDFVTSIDECWRLIAWNYYYAGGENTALARTIAENKYVELKKRGKRYMTSLFGILVSKIRTEDPEFFKFGELYFDTLDILEEAIKHLVAIPDSLDYPNALYQRIVLELSYLENTSSPRSDQHELLKSIEEKLEETLHYYRSLSSDQGIANLSYWIGSAKYLNGEFDEAKTAFEAALATYRNRKDRYGQVSVLFRLAIVCFRQNHMSGGTLALEEAWSICQELGWVERYKKNLEQAVSRNPDLEGLLSAANSRTRH